MWLRIFKEHIKKDIEKELPDKFSVEYGVLSADYKSIHRLRFTTQEDTYTRTLFSVRLTQFPENCGIVLVAGLISDTDELRSIGLRAIKSQCYDAGYTQLLYTVNEKQEALKEALLEFGFVEHPSLSFLNHRSGKQITYLSYDLRSKNNV